MTTFFVLVDDIGVVGHEQVDAGRNRPVRRWARRLGSLSVACVLASGLAQIPDVDHLHHKFNQPGVEDSYPNGLGGIDTSGLRPEDLKPRPNQDYMPPVPAQGGKLLIG